MNNSNRGSTWRRWDPHVHAPGTILNDQFGSKSDPDRTTAWQAYSAALEGCCPTIEAIGVTDYYSLDTYEAVRKLKEQGRLQNCGLIFPNVEMRLNLGTVKGSSVNVHLLISPDDPDHVAQAKRFLSRLEFEAHGDQYSCTSEDLIRLGEKAGAPANSKFKALAMGATQFKVSFDQLREVYRASEWAKTNILIAVAGGKNDGSSGLNLAADTTVRQEVEKIAHVIFASGVAQREFWLGQKSASIEDLISNYGGLKPCLHGSDGHELEKVGVPDDNRYCWIKGDLTFDALRQACIDPAGRAYVGEKSPITAAPSQVISEISISNAGWLKTPKIQLNPGLVAIIGARGSGKTALADMIAAGCDAIPESLNKQSFLHRARDFLQDSAVSLTWGGGDKETRWIAGEDDQSADRYPRARYLSQQFVEELCSSDGMTDDLLREIERVIFDAHSVSERDGAADFDDLLEIRVSRYREARSREESALANLSERINVELEKSKLASGYKKQIEEKEKLVKSLSDDRKKLVSKGSEARLKRLDEVTAAAEKVRGYVRYFNGQEQQLLTLQDEVADVRQNSAPETLRDRQERHSGAKIEESAWDAFLLDFKGPVDDLLKGYLGTTRKSIESWKGAAVSQPAKPEIALIASDADLKNLNLALLEAEVVRLQGLVGADNVTAQKFVALSKKIIEEQTALDRLKEKFNDADGAKGRAASLVKEREQAYLRLFEAVLNEEGILNDLYAPIKSRLEASQGTLKKMSFSVSRVANCEQWAASGEELLDLRKQGPFKGQGTLKTAVEVALKPAWESGDANAVANAMKAFREEHQDNLLSHAPVQKIQQVEYRAWLKRFAQWLYGTDHISVVYGVDYAGIDIRNLSPGTRGIVLLLLYLALDDSDGRPLIIDQPEENLDPKSIFDELVALFLTAKERRQVIIVTHNANLVINTDADQIIVASAGAQAPDDLPDISYLCGGLENNTIRTAVCEILEGGDRAFKERARRLRVRLER